MTFNNAKNFETAAGLFNYLSKFTEAERQAAYLINPDGGDGWVFIQRETELSDGSVVTDLVQSFGDQE